MWSASGWLVWLRLASSMFRMGTSRCALGSRWGALGSLTRLIVDGCAGGGLACIGMSSNGTPSSIAISPTFSVALEQPHDQSNDEEDIRYPSKSNRML